MRTVRGRVCGIAALVAFALVTATAGAHVPASIGTTTSYRWAQLPARITLTVPLTAPTTSYRWAQLPARITTG
jgi:hypothetical protein